jgi:putative ABC transport system permease protein
MTDQQPRWRRYLRFWRTNARADVEDEFSFHVAEAMDDLVAGGMEPRAAREAALRRFGDIETTKLTCRTLAEEQETYMRRSEILGVIKQDAIYALRLMRAQPTFTAAIVLTLALGIGATTAIFSVVNAVLLRPLPYTDAERIVALNETWRENFGSLSVGHFHDWTEKSSSFTVTAAGQGRTYNLTDGEPARFAGLRVTPTFFQVMHMPPVLGRYFLAGETDASRVVVLSQGLWQARFNADSSIVGKEITLNGEKHTVIGIAPAAHALTPFDARLWTILTFPPELRNNYGAHTYLAWGKLKPGVTIQQGQADLERVTEDIRERNPDEMKERGVAVRSYREVRIDTFDTQLWVLLGAVTFVLLIGCGNVASLLLARATSRRKEIAIRGALGGARSRLVRQLLTESLLLAAIGGATGLLIARYGVRFLVGMGPSWLPRLSEAGLHLEVLLFAAGATLLSGVLFGLAPALRATRVDLQTELRDGGRGSRGVVRDRVRAGLIVTEIAVALVLLVSAGLFLRSAHRLQGVALGFDPTGVSMMRVALPADRYDSATAVHRAFTDIVTAMRAIPGVQSAGAGSRVPMWGISIDMGVRVDGRPPATGAQMPIGHLRLVTPGFSETVGIPLKRGRMLQESDGAAGAPRVIVVNETFARLTFGKDDPIGQRISGWTQGPEPEWREIVGVIGDVRAFGQEQDVPPEIYIPHSQVWQAWWNAHQRNMTIVVKARPGANVVPSMREALKRVDPMLPTFDLQTMDFVLSQSTAVRRFNTLLLSMLGATGLILAAIGIYGVIAFFVSQRTHEIGVRVALGATTRNVVRLVVQQAVILAVIGVALGSVLAFWATRVLGELLFQVNARDPLAYGSAAAVLLLVALAAAWIPARRAARVDPVRALSSA